MPRPRSRTLRTGRWSEAGNIYLLTLVTDRRRLWQPGFHDRVLRAEDDLVAVARYVVANPIRAGLSRSFGGYPFRDAVWISTDAGRAP